MDLGLPAKLRPSFEAIRDLEDTVSGYGRVTSVSAEAEALTTNAMEAAVPDRRRRRRHLVVPAHRAA